ncbi:bifunctional acetate--CoA ligase family protein/GNAT family N-acetyltransferase [Actinoalloteichus hymeniacidonis]|uniref:Acyl-CoA synthetase (NDP forming) n=1 Tax=Actinoalloteichus hymeniacidonis TaxID=340345 RepID=A0AAC9HNP0_9PSEU|nr:bifunctional GNAT family N-acetyltransferase/acetate--CoA ligase family protein [Actinoalloteichus hymeniacidonis]AOS62553.1 acyl-CoA synthetase (NDP forming) [Actinoalloteichus hymeniacidonis]MBB5909416.1 acyl-CoA synthetase (NDP forming)/RimJ/RimL family protein N-acetyltransferase [Actinoalloteichus hymeniacidonis]
MEHPPEDTDGVLSAATNPVGAEPPEHWAADVVLSDGGTVHLRPLRPEDGPRLVALHSRMSERTRYLRYFGAYPRMPAADVRRFSTVDHHERVAFGAVLGGDIVAVGRFDRLPGGDSAEVAFVVEDGHQGRGLGSILLEHLAAAGRERGLRRFEAEVLAENGQMVAVFRAAGYSIRREPAEGALHLEFTIDPTVRSVEVVRSREQAAEARSVHNLLHPRSVAVIGASSDRSKIGNAVLTNLLAADFAGPVYPVNGEHRSVRGVRAYPEVLDIPDAVDLAVVTVPAARMDEVLDGCLAKGVKALVVVSAGFGETGADGLVAERRLVEAARAHGMRVVGPNALGVVNNDVAVRLNATLAPRLPGMGRVGFFCQSGALGTAILATAASRGLGLSTFVSAGNRADVSGNDLLQYWQTDSGTDVVLLYLESFGNPRKFGRLARRLGRTKPIVAVKSGRHAGPPALAATAVPVDEAGVAALFEQSGVIRVETLAQLFDTALVLAHQPLPDGLRVAVVGNSTALGLLASDAVHVEGLTLADGPVDVGASASPEEFATAVRSAIGSPDVDALVAVFVPPISVAGSAYARALREAVSAPPGGTRKPVVSTFLAAEGIPDELAVAGLGGSPGYGSVPSYPSPERAVAALARAARYARWRSAPQGVASRPAGLAVQRAADAVTAWRAAAGPEPITLTDAQTTELLAHYGIELVPFAQADSVDDVVAMAEELGYPVVLKSTDPRFRHRPDLVGVRLDLGGRAEVEAAYRSLRTISTEPAVYVQRMAPRGVSCRLGVQDDPSFGTLLSFGLAGIVGDLLGDRVYRAVPLTDIDVASVIREPRAAPLLTGYRGSEPTDLTALEDLVSRVSALAEDVQSVRALSLEPVLSSTAGAFVTGARIVLGPEPSADIGPRRLR